MAEEVKKLSEKHLNEAKKMVLRNRKKKSCNKCYDRGYVGINQENMLIPCPKCINDEALWDEWKAYVKADPELTELYGDSLDDENKKTDA